MCSEALLAAVRGVGGGQLGRHLPHGQLGDHLRQQQRLATATWPQQEQWRLRSLQHLRQRQEALGLLRGHEDEGVEVRQLGLFPGLKPALKARNTRASRRIESTW